MTFFVVLNQN
jgi:DNA-binding protein H-NS